MPTKFYGPFYVGVLKRQRGGGYLTEEPTDIQVQAGDTIITHTSGLVSVGGNFLGYWVVDADGDDWETNSDFPAPSLRRYSLICKIGSGGTYLQGGVCQSFSAPASGKLILDVNDGPDEDNRGSWTVFVSHTTGGDSAPPCRSWRFDTVAGAGGIFGAGVGYSPSVVILRDIVHVFYRGLAPGLHHNYAPDYLNHVVLYHNIEQVGEPYYTKVTEEILVNHDINWQVSSTVLRKTIHVFYHDYTAGTLRHASAKDGTNWVFDVVDGQDNSEGRVNDSCGACSTPVVYRNRLHMFYSAYNDTPASYLRHAGLEDDTWKYETLDFQGGPDGRVDSLFGQTASAIVDANDILHVFYYDYDNTNLRHAWWDEKNWRFEILDGSGDRNRDDSEKGQRRGDVGAWSTPAIFNNALYVFYYDKEYGNVRCATFDNGIWSFELLDGGSGPNGRTKSMVGNGVMATLVLPDQLSLFYYDSSNGNLRHAWKKTGSNWFFETLDGEGGDRGRINENVGSDASAVLQHYHGAAGTYDVIHLFYADLSNADLRYATW